MAKNIIQLTTPREGMRMLGPEGRWGSGGLGFWPLPSGMNAAPGVCKASFASGRAAHRAVYR
jgi:hypothetical protein